LLLRFLLFIFGGDRFTPIKAEVKRLEKMVKQRDLERAALEMERQLKLRMDYLRDQLGITTKD